MDGTNKLQLKVMFNTQYRIFRYFFFVQITRALSVGNLSNVHRACSFFTISNPFCIDNARVIGRKIRYIKNSILSGRHVTTFTGSSSGPKIKQIQDYIDVILDLFSLRAWNSTLSGRHVSTFTGSSSGLK